jgi:hypothetical protein
MLPAHEEMLSIQLVTNNKYARQVRSCAAGLNINIVKEIFPQRIFEAVAIGGFRNQEQPQKIQMQEQAKSTRHTK